MNFIEKLALLKHALSLRRKRKSVLGVGGVTGGLTAPGAAGPSMGSSLSPSMFVDTAQTMPAAGGGAALPSGGGGSVDTGGAPAAGGSGPVFDPSAAVGKGRPAKVDDATFGKTVDFYKSLSDKDPKVFGNLSGTELEIAKKYFPSAAAMRHHYGAPISLGLGIARQESGAGISSRLARESNNLWGIKHHIKGTPMWSHAASKIDQSVDHKKPGEMMNYQVPNTKDPFNFFGNFITNDRYRKASLGGGDLGSIARGIGHAGYTDHQPWIPGVTRMGAPFKVLDDAFTANPFKG